MKVSVIMPCYNVEDYVAQAVESVLAQTERDFEFVIIDDGSTDRTLDVVSGFADSRLRILAKPSNTGMADTVRVGLENTSAALVCAPCADDAMDADYLEAMTAQFDRDDIGYAVCHLRIMDLHGDPLKMPAHRDAPNPVGRTKAEWRQQFFHCQNAGFGMPMYRRSVIESVGGIYDGSYRQLCDLELYLRLLDAGYAPRVVERELCTSRIRPGQLSEPTVENLAQHHLQLHRIRQKHYFRRAA